MKIRLAESEDAADILAWRNDPVSCAMFIAGSPVDADQHNWWIHESLNNPLRSMFIGLEGGEKVGICRFDFDAQADIAEVSINLNPQMRGRRLSAPFLRESIALFRERRLCALAARIRKENIPSIRCFTECGFVFQRSEENFNYYRMAAA
jgi:RimJ/RimL family protein N-acetyltransferase